MANPRKFSEKIALQKQKQAEGTAEFEKIMKEVYATKMDETQANQKILEYCSSNAPSSDSNAVNVNKSGGSGANSGASGGGASPDGTIGNNVSGGGSPTAYRESPTAYRESRGRSVGVGPMRRPSERKQDRSPYGSTTNTNAIGISGSGTGGLANNVQNIAYLSPPMDSSWRRSNSDSALHQSLNMAIANDNAFGVGETTGVVDGANSLHANYQHHQLHGQRSHSPNIGRSFSPQAQRRKGNLMQQQQQQFLQHQLQIQQQHQQLQQQHMQMQQHQQQQQQQQQQPSQMPQQVPNYNAKFLNCNNMPMTNSLFKPLQDQAMMFANTGSLPDLTSVHYAQQQPPQHHHNQQQHNQQAQNTLSPILSPHNNGRDRDKSPSPFSPTGGGRGGTTSPYHQQHQSPTSAANTPTVAQASSPHLSFTNLSVQSPTPTGHAGSFGNLTTLGAAGSTGNLTDYRQPLNPPSPGSSPGLLTSASGTELHTSAPASPTRHPQTSMQSGLLNYNEKNNLQQTFDRYSPSIVAGGANPTVNSLNPSFHNHFEQFSLGDSSSSPDQPNFQVNSFTALEFDDFVSGGGGGGSSSGSYSQNLIQSKILDFTGMNATATAADRPVSNVTATVPRNNNNNNLQQQQQQQQTGQSIDQQRLSNNNSANGPCCANNNNNGSAGGGGGAQHVDAPLSASPIPSPAAGCLTSPSSPLPIPISSHQQHQSQHNAQNQHHQLSLSLHSQHSPHHTPLHSPHQASSPLSASSPSGITTMGMASTNVSTENSSTHASNVANHATMSQHQHQHQQSHSANTPTTNIPSIIFSDYSSNTDFSREIFDTLDLDLGQIDVAGLQMLSDQNSVMISDPTIEDSFRRDLN